jgi:hypothetical protein
VIGKAEKGSAARDRVAWGDGRGGNAKWGARGRQHDVEKHAIARASLEIFLRERCGRRIKRLAC